MLVKKTCIVAATGQYGPFKDKKGTPQENDVVPYVELVDPDGGGVFRATKGQDVTEAPPAVMESADVQLEFYVRDGSLKCRYLSMTAAARVKAA